MNKNNNFNISISGIKNFGNLVIGDGNIVVNGKSHRYIPLPDDWEKATQLVIEKILALEVSNEKKNDLIEIVNEVNQKSHTKIQPSNVLISSFTKILTQYIPKQDLNEWSSFVCWYKSKNQNIEN